MKMLFTVYLFFLFVFVHGMESEPSSALVGTWKCVGQDTQRNYDKPFAFFNEDGTGNWLVDVPDRAKIDERFKFTVLSQGVNTYKYKYKIRWENELNESGTRDVVLKGDTLLFEGKKWLQKLNIDGSALVGTWKCVGSDTARCIEKFVFFNEDGSGSWLVESPDRAKINPSFKYFVDKRDGTNYIIHWFNQEGESGMRTQVNLNAMNNTLFVVDGKDGEKEWLQKLNKKEENGNEIILENITWELSDTLTEKIEDDTEEHEEFIWHVIDSSKILTDSPIFNSHIDTLPANFEKKINQLYKYAPYKNISEEKRWCLVLHGKFKTSENPFNYRIPISLKIIPMNVEPGKEELTAVLKFGKFGNLMKSFETEWDELKFEHLSALKLYSFSQGGVVKNTNICDDAFDAQMFLEHLQKKYGAIEEKRSCPNGHSKFDYTILMSEFDCDACKKKSSGKIFHTQYSCNGCPTDFKKVCNSCVLKKKVGPESKKKMKEFLVQKTGATYTDEQTEHILQVFLMYIFELNWKIILTEKTMSKDPYKNISVPLLGMYKKIASDDSEKCSMENLENTQSLWARLSIFYHQFMMDIESDSKNLHNWTFQLDVSELETINVDFTSVGYKQSKIIPAHSSDRVTFTVGYQIENQVLTQQQKAKSFNWSITAGTKYIGLTTAKTNQEMETNINQIITTTAQTQSQETEIESCSFDRNAYILTFDGTVRSNDKLIQWSNPNFTVIRNVNEGHPNNDPKLIQDIKNLFKL